MIPVFISGIETGTAEIRRDGLYTFLDIKSRLCEGIVRLYAHGRGKSAYIGIPVPDGECLRLSKSFSPSEMAKLPESIELISDTPSEALLPAVSPTQLQISPVWKPGTHGTLLCSDKQSILLALPCREGGSFPGCRTDRINGKLYMIFRY